MSTYANIVEQSGLFASLTPAEFATLLNQATQMEIPAGGILMREGEVGHECYIILQGSVQVFTEIGDGREIVIARREPGAVIGEQALLPGSSGRRNASIRALTDVLLLRITEEQFLGLLAANHPLKEQLRRVGEEQAQTILVRQSVVFRSLPFDSTDGDWFREEVFADGETVFRQGDVGDKVYLVLSGTAGVYEEGPEGRKRLLGIGMGRIFGEMALVERKPRSATIIAEGDLRVISIDGDHFLRMYEQAPEVREYMQTLKKVYALGRGGVATEYLGRFMGKECITTVASRPRGETLVSSLVIGEDIFNLSVVGGDIAGQERIRFQDTQRGIERELVLAGLRVVGVTSQGQWDELGKVYRMVLEATPVTSDQLDLFRKRGILQRVVDIPLYQDHEIVCNCLQIKRGDLRLAVEGGCHTVDKLMEQTGAGSVCGGCRPLLREMIGHADWVPVHVAEVLPAASDIRSFRFKPLGNGNVLTLKPAKPGQHVVVQAHIGGRWVQRPYTISSAADETGYREITVKREAQGLFSGWLFADGWKDALIRVSDPEGDYYAELNDQQPIVCLVGGIGMTPALAMCRSIIRSGTQQPLYIDYSVSTREQCAYAEELQAAAAKHSNIKVNLRFTRETGRLSLAHIQQISQAYPNAHYYICGPGIFQTAAEGFLKEAHVPRDHVHIEEFTAVGAKPASPPRTYFYLGLALLVAFLLQDIFKLKIPWLEMVQAGDSYKRWTGLLLTLYMAAQFLLSYVRVRGNMKASVQQYRLHKLQGALAPLFFYIHSTQMGYAFLTFLSVVFFANVGVGLFNHEWVSNADLKRQYSHYWLIAHVILSLLTVALVAIHIYVVFAFR